MNGAVKQSFGGANGVVSGSTISSLRSSEATVGAVVVVVGVATVICAQLVFNVKLEENTGRPAKNNSSALGKIE